MGVCEGYGKEAGRISFSRSFLPQAAFFLVFLCVDGWTSGWVELDCVWLPFQLFVASTMFVSAQDGKKTSSDSGKLS